MSMQDTGRDRLYYVINEDKDYVVMRTIYKEDAFDKADVILENGNEATVAKTPV